MSSILSYTLAFTALSLLPITSELCVAQEDLAPLTSIGVDFRLKEVGTPIGNLPRRFPADVKEAVGIFQKNHQLHRLLRSEDKTIALLGAWQMVSHQESGEKAKDAEWFLGFFQGRVGIDPPDAWKRSLSLQVQSLHGTSCASDEGNVDDSKPDEPWDVTIGKISIRMYKSQGISSLNERLVFRKGDLVCEIDKANLSVQGRGKRHLDYDMNSKYLVVALSSFSDSSEVMAFGIPNGKMLWHRVSWGNLEMLTVPFRQYNCMRHREVIVEGDCVAVFSDHHSTPYCEVYDASSGDCKLRFSSSTWGAK